MASRHAGCSVNYSSRLEEIEAELIKLCCNCKHIDCRYGTCESLVAKRRELKGKRNYGGKRGSESRDNGAKRVTFEGRTLTLCEWEGVLGIHRETLRKRLSAGWSINDAFLTPLRRRKSEKQKRD